MPIPPREGGGASLQGRMRGEAAPSPFSSPVAGSKSSFFVRKEGRGDSLLQASPPVPLSPAQPRPVAGAPGPLWAGSLLPPQCLVSPGPLRPPVLWPCPCPGGRGRRNALPVPLRLRGLHGRILFPRCRWATWREGREDGGGVFSPDSWSASLPQASLSDHG